MVSGIIFLALLTRICRSYRFFSPSDIGGGAPPRIEPFESFRIGNGRREFSVEEDDMSEFWREVAGGMAKDGGG